MNIEELTQKYFNANKNPKEFLKENEDAVKKIFSSERQAQNEIKKEIR